MTEHDPRLRPPVPAEAAADAPADGTGASRLAVLWRRLMRFGIVGVCATITHVGVLTGLVEIGGADPRYANVAGFLIAACVSYFGNYLWSFGSSHGHRGTVPRFAVVATLLFLTSQGLMLLVLDVLGLHYGFGIALMVIVMPLVSFVAQQRLVFLRPGAPS